MIMCWSMTGSITRSVQSGWRPKRTKYIPYYIVESKTAKGYILDRTKHEVFLQYDDSATEPVGYTLTVKNKPDHPLPQTGGDYRPWLFALGGALLAGAGVVIYRRRRRRIAG